VASTAFVVLQETADDDEGDHPVPADEETGLGTDSHRSGDLPANRSALRSRTPNLASRRPA
jgi:hypothetical protein